MEGRDTGGRPAKVQLERAYRLLNRSLESYYEKRYEQAVELCGESLTHLLPGGTDPAASPEEKSELFLRTYSSVLPIHEAQAIAGVFTFFQSRKARFHLRKGASLPNRDWWQFLRLRRDEAEEVVRATRLALNSIEERWAAEG